MSLLSYLLEQSGLVSTVFQLAIEYNLARRINSAFYTLFFYLCKGNKDKSLFHRPYPFLAFLSSDFLYL